MNISINGEVSLSNDILKGYRDAAPMLIKRFESISAEEKLAPVRAHLPLTPSRILDIGAGTGGDAGWFSSQGHNILAVEPTAAFRQAGSLKHPSQNIEWISDVLPALSRVSDRGEVFDLILLSAVWHHLNDPARAKVFSVLQRLLKANGKIILSIRQGPGAPTRMAYPSRVTDVIALAEAQDFILTHSVAAPSLQVNNRIAGVTWVWLVFHAPNA